MSYELVSTSTLSTGSLVSHYRSSQRITIREAIAIQVRDLEMQFSTHPAYAQIKADVEATTFVDGLNLDESMTIQAINEIVPRGCAIEAIAQKYTAVDYWEPSQKSLSSVSMTLVENTLNKQFPQFSGQLYVSLGYGSKPRFDIGFSGASQGEYQAAMDTVFEYFKGLGYKTAWEHQNKASGRVKQVWVYR